MSNTYTSLHYHIVFSTKDREPWIAPEIEGRVWGYLATVARQYDMTPAKVGGLDDHVHLVVAIPPTLAMSKAIQLLKGSSSRWIRQTFPDLDVFRWQDGYGAFTVSTSVLPATITYVEQQRAAHEARTFQDEFRALLRRHEVEHDERYLWA
jgi:REP element-mobilizing transposase RayT